MRLLVLGQRAEIGGGQADEVRQQCPPRPEDEQDGSEEFRQLDEETESEMGEDPDQVEQDPPHDEAALLVRPGARKQTLAPGGGGMGGRGRCIHETFRPSCKTIVPAMA